MVVTARNPRLHRHRAVACVFDRSGSVECGLNDATPYLVYKATVATDLLGHFGVAETCSGHEIVEGCRHAH